MSEYLLWLLSGWGLIILIVFNWVWGLVLLREMSRRRLPISRKLTALLFIPFAFPIYCAGVALYFTLQAVWAGVWGDIAEVMMPESAESVIARAFGYHDYRPRWIEERDQAFRELLEALEAKDGG